MLNLNLPDDSSKANEKHIPENRETKRMKFKGTIMLCDDSSEYYCYGQIVNISGDGMYFESNYGYRPGTILDIRIDNPPFKASPKYYAAIAKWCIPLSLNKSIIPFGVGVKFL